uniref:Transmembrane protein n=1 Tax=Toxoplasma gondii (strain ATCC 50861 / VEG) TaxID=432359 RepID=A0A0F7UU85_TOXGV|nr:TPA: hypothetical protein BN1205_040875 [Toxoplasma gondii VEG]
MCSTSPEIACHEFMFLFDNVCSTVDCSLRFLSSLLRCTSVMVLLFLMSMGAVSDKLPFGRGKMVVHFMSTPNVAFLAAAFYAICACAASASDDPVLRSELLNLKARMEAVNFNSDLLRFRMETASGPITRYSGLVEREKRGEPVAFRELILAANEASAAKASVTADRQEARKDLKALMEQTRGIARNVNQRPRMTASLREQVNRELQNAKRTQLAAVRLLDSEELRKMLTHS